MSNEKREKIIDLKIKIDDLKEYLYSDTCRSCGEIALQLDQYIQELSTLLNIDDTNS
jgi:hypothetical protein